MTAVVHFDVDFVDAVCDGRRCIKGCHKSRPLIFRQAMHISTKFLFRRPRGNASSKNRRFMQRNRDSIACVRAEMPADTSAYLDVGDSRMHVIEDILRDARCTTWLLPVPSWYFAHRYWLRIWSFIADEMLMAIPCHRLLWFHLGKIKLAIPSSAAYHLSFHYM